MHRRPGPAGFRLDPEPHAPRRRAGLAVVEIDQQFAERLAKIVEEPIGDLAAFDHRPIQGRQEGTRIVAAVGLELFGEVVGPDGAAHFVAGQVEMGECGLAQVAQTRFEPVGYVADISRGGLGAEVVRGQSVGVRAGHLEPLAGVRADIADERPFPGRHVPGQGGRP
jgi:hypothetical protein